MKKQIWTLGIAVLLTAAMAFAQTPAQSSSSSETGASAQSANPAQSQSTMSQDQDKSKANASAAVDDDTLRRQVKEQLSTNPALSGVNADVDHGTVTLTGAVASKDERSDAKKMVKVIPGVAKVKDNIKVDAKAAAAGAGTGGTASGLPASDAGAASSSTTPPSSSTMPAGGTATSPSSTTMPSTGTTATPPGEASPTTSSTPPSTAGSIAGNSQSTTTSPSQSQATSPTESQSSATPSSSTSATSAGPFGSSGQQSAMGSNGDLQMKIDQAMKNEPTLANANVTVNVTDTSIDLAGTAPTGKEKQTAKRIAQSFAGNRKVNDKVNVTRNGSDMSNPSMQPPDSNSGAQKPPMSENPPMQKPPVR